MTYLLVFAMNAANLQPVVLKDCVPYKSESAAKIESVVKEIEKTSKCEKSEGAKSWSCMNPQAGIITKIVLMTDKKECAAFPQEASKKLKTLLGK
ncbi:hypothetical protein [Bdellovibrio sp. HCB209]|uniref:hypothetical protein n=1 Tax=Bdellovibrio sp. HCB209 TaxID=3394354 RepID=UPI0039B3DAEC